MPSHLRKRSTASSNERLAFSVLAAPPLEDAARVDRRRLAAHVAELAMDSGAFVLRQLSARLYSPRIPRSADRYIDARARSRVRARGSSARMAPSHSAPSPARSRDSQEP